MKIGGIQKLTLLDYPGKIACTVFLPGCTFRCPFCHNADLVLDKTDPVSEQELFAFLEKRKSALQGVCVTGGEPTVQQELPAFLARIRAMGYSVKLDTNGSNPGMLKNIINEGLCQYVAMDIKHAPETYALAAGTDAFTERVKESVAFLKKEHVPYEFRTTVVKELHTREDMEKIGQWLAGDEPYFLQCFRDSDHILEPGLTEPTKEDMQQFLECVRSYLPQAQIRGL